MLRSRSATNKTAWLRRTALTVMVRSYSSGQVRAGGARSGGDAEATGPGDFLGGGEGELQEADCLELTGPLQGAGVDRLQAAGRHDAGQGGLRVGVVTGD